MLFSKPKISVLRLSGPIGDLKHMNSLSLHSLNKYIEQAFAVNKLEVVFLVINSPGGSPVQSEMIATRISTLSKEKKVPVYSFIEDVGASGGYWIACCASKIFASKNSIVGSIGVISASFGLKNAIEKLGITRRLYYTGKNKSMLDPFKDENEEGVEKIKSIQKHIHNSFIKHVKFNRKNLSDTGTDLFDGSVWTGYEAKNLGLIDDFQDIYSFSKNNFPNAKLKFINIKESWFKKKFGIDICSIPQELYKSFRSQNYIDTLI